MRKFKETVEIRSSVINRLRSHRYFPVGVFMCAFLAAACFHVWQRVKVLELVKEVSYLRVENSDLVNNVKKVYSEISSLEMGSRIELYACDTLGLQPITADRLITLAPKKAQTYPQDQFALLKAGIKRALRYAPVVKQTSATASELRPIEIDSLATQGKSR